MNKNSSNENVKCLVDQVRKSCIVLKELTLQSEGISEQHLDTNKKQDLKSLFLTIVYVS